MLCPCGTLKIYEDCCADFHEFRNTAEQAEKLMRSRYSAYVLKKYDYVLHTYGSNERKNLSVEELSNAAHEQNWVKLTLQFVDEISKPAIVEFSAYYLINNSLYELRERSRFEVQDNALKYIDGDILVNDLIKTVSRNDTCPCGSNKKFKKCCYLKIAK